MAGEILAQLPEDLRTNEAFTGMSTAGDMAKALIETRVKLTEFDGKVKESDGKVKDLTTRLENSIPKLTKDATDVEKSAYNASMGIPKTPEEYELAQPKEGKTDEAFAKTVKEVFHSLGVSKDHAKGLSAWWNEYMGMAQTKWLADIEAKRVEADKTLRTELGDKYDATIKNVSEVWKKFSAAEKDGKIDTSFLTTMKLVPITDAKDGNPVGNDARFIHWVMNIAKLVGEDVSPKGRPGGQKAPTGGMSYPNSPAPLGQA